MTEVHYWKCGVCGKQFNDPDECKRHELSENAPARDFITYDKDNKPVEWPWSGFDYESVVAFKINNEEAWNFLDDYIRHDLGYCSPMEVVSTPKEWPVVVYCSDYSDGWVNIKEEYEFYKNLVKRYE